MKTILKNVQIKAVNSWLPSNSLEMLSLGSLYGEFEVNTIMKATGVNRVRIANKEEVDVAKIVGTSDMKKVTDLKGNPLLLFVNAWSVGMTEDRNPDLVLTEFRK